MGVRFSRRIKILPGVSVNLSRSGVSTSIGVKGAHVTLGHAKIRGTVGLPGTGISYTQVEGAHQTHGEVSGAAPAKSYGNGQLEVPRGSSAWRVWLAAGVAMTITIVALLLCELR